MIIGYFYLLDAGTIGKQLFNSLLYWIVSPVTLGFSDKAYEIFMEWYAPQEKWCDGKYTKNKLGNGFDV